jgi:ESS family glutamate:Na+ symporter
MLQRSEHRFLQLPDLRFPLRIALVLFIYFLTYLASLGLTNFLTASAPGLAKSLSPLIWGFNFIIGSFLATLFRGLFKLLQKAKLMTRQYPNNYLLARVSGLAFDYMVIAGIASIEIKDVQDLWLPFILMCIFGTFVTLWFLQWLCKKIYPSYYYEGLLSMYGMLTGTISSGILLLREIDPHFRTPAAINLVTGSSFAIFFGAPMLLFIGLAPESDTMLFLTVGMIFVYLLALVAFILKAGKKTRKA